MPIATALYSASVTLVGMGAISEASSNGNAVTIYANNSFIPNELVTIENISNSGSGTYDGIYSINSVDSHTPSLWFTYTDTTSSSLGTAQMSTAIAIECANYPPPNLISRSQDSIFVDRRWAIETSLDVEWAHAVASRANIVLVEGVDDNSDNLFGSISNVDRLYSGLSVVSMSFGGQEFSTENDTVLGYDGNFVTPTGHSGITFVASSGDKSFPSYPAASPNVVGVGGTTLTIDPNNNNNWQTETAWSNAPGSEIASGGGVSQYEHIQSYQTGLGITGSFRQVPDVAFDGDGATGVAVYDSFNFGSPPWYRVGGTSLSAPAWTGLIAIADQLRVSRGAQNLNGVHDTLPGLYQMEASSFHDITSGHNSWNMHSEYAGPGYDRITGRGTPIANLMVASLVGGTATQLSVSAPSLVGAGTTITNNPFNVTVTAKDSLGNIVPRYVGTVHFTSTDGLAVLPNNFRFGPGDNGTHVFIGPPNDTVSLRSAGNQTITATDTITSTITGTSNNISVTTHLVVTAFTPIANGFTATFTEPFQPADLVLYGGVNIATATESQTTATITTTAAHGFSVGQSVIIALCGGYNGTFPIIAVPTNTTFTYTAPSGLTTVTGSGAASPAPDVKLVGATNGAMSGSLFIDPSNMSITFKGTANNLSVFNGFNSVVLPDDTYTVTLVSGSGSSGFLDASNVGLDGGNNGGQANYTNTFTTNYQANSRPVLGIPDFARGPAGGQNIKVPNDTANGIPITLYNASSVTDVTFTLTYNPQILKPTSGGTGDSTYSGSTFTMGSITNIDTTHSTLTFTFHNNSAHSGTVVPGDILANVPNSAVNLYKVKEILQLGTIVVNGAGFTGVAANGLHINAYFADVNGDDIINPWSFSSISAASETGTTVVITAPNSFVLGNLVTIAGIAPSGYDIYTTIVSATSSSFTYSAASGLGPATLHVSSSITGVSESGTTVTITAANSFIIGEQVIIAGITSNPSGYDGTFTVTGASAGSFTYTAAVNLGTPTYPNATATLNATAFFSPEVETMNSVANGSWKGFPAYSLLDPAIVGDPALDYSVDYGDVSTLNSYLYNLPTSIPTPPGLSGFGNLTAPDPTLSLGSAVKPTDGVFTVPVLLDHPDPEGSTGLTEAILALTYDPSVLSVSPADITLGTIPGLDSGWQLTAVVDQSTGQIGIEMYSMRPITTTQAGSLVNINFHVLADVSVPATPVELVSSVSPAGRQFATLLADIQGGLLLSPGLDRLLIDTGFDPVSSNAAGERRGVSPPVEIAAPSSDQGLERLGSMYKQTTGAVPYDALTLMDEDAVVNEAGAIHAVPASLSVTGRLAFQTSGLTALTTQPAAQTFQIGNLPLLNTLFYRNSPGQLAADQLFLAMGWASEAPDPNAQSPIQEKFNGFMWDGANSLPDRLEARTHSSFANTAYLQAAAQEGERTDIAVVSQYFAQLADDLDDFSDLGD